MDLHSTAAAPSREKRAVDTGSPFPHDPSQTAAFAPLYAAKPVDGGDQIKAVVIGGGTGAPVSIRTLLSMGVRTSAVVAMADDGGSTGILREEAGVTPPGDIRKCICAMAADPNDPLTRAFKYRFPFADNHTLGNLMLSALEEATGAFPEAVTICENLLHARGRVYPSTLDRVSLVARTRDGRYIEGQAVACHSRCALAHVQLRGAGRIVAYEPALRAIREADLIVLGPGSLFTSIIPNLLVPGVVDAIRQSKAATLFVCSLADMQGETWGLTAREHVEALLDHGMRGLLDYVLVHSASAVLPDSSSAEAGRAPGDASRMGNARFAVDDAQQAREGRRVRPVRIDRADLRAIQSLGPAVIVRNLVDPERPTWHDPFALREAFTGVLRLCRSQRR